MNTRLVLGLIGLGLNTGLSLNIVPLMSGAFIDELGFAESQVGTVLGVQILLGAIVGIFLSTRMHILVPRTAGLIASAGVFVATVGFATLVPLWALVANAALMGVCFGVLGASGAAAISMADRVDRTAAMVAVGISLLAALLTVPLAHALGAGGRRALFVADLAVIVLSIALVLVLPSRRSSAAASARMPFVGTLTAPIVLVSIFLNIGTNGIWAFCERIGVSLGFDSKSVGEILAGSTVFAVLGGASAGLVARPTLERRWALVGVTMYGATSAAIAFASNRTIFVVALCAQAFFFVFSAPFLLAVAIGQDRSGGLAAAAGGWSTLLGASAPVIAGYAIEGNGFVSLGWFAVVTTVFAMLALLAVDRRGIVKPLANGSVAP